MEIYKFSDGGNVPDTAPTMTQEEIINKYTDLYKFWTQNLLSTWIFRLMWWAYDCRDFLNKYLVKQYWSYTEYYAPNKTTLRKVLYGNIEWNIIELK